MGETNLKNNENVGRPMEQRVKHPSEKPKKQLKIHNKTIIIKPKKTKI